MFRIGLLVAAEGEQRSRAGFEREPARIGWGKGALATSEEVRKASRCVAGAVSPGR